MTNNEMSRFLVWVAVLAALGAVSAFGASLFAKHSTTYGLLHLSGIVLIGTALVVCLVAIVHIMRADRRDRSDHH